MKILRNVLLTLSLSAIVTELGVYLVCYAPFFDSCRNANVYWLSLLVVWLFVLSRFLYAQYGKTYFHFKKRERSSLLPVGDVGATYQKTANVIDTLWNYDPVNTIKLGPKLAAVEETITIPPQSGWEVTYTSGFRVVVDTREFYYWLLDVAIKQAEMEASGAIMLRSPMSQRNSGLPRRKWEIYRQLLLEAKAVTQVNGNILVLKYEVRENPSLVVNELNKIRKVVVL